jgi:hypothetical protein
VPEVRLPVTEEQIERWVEELFLGGSRNADCGMKAMVGYVILKYGAWEQAMNAGMSSEAKTAFRATWALEWAYEYAGPDGLPPWLFDRMVSDFAASTNGSLHRVYAKMLCDRMRFGGVRPDDAQAGMLAEKCFDLVIDPTVKTSVRFWCLEILSELAPRIDWVAEELPAIVMRISEAPDCPPGMRVVTRGILGRAGTPAAANLATH